MHKRLHAFLHKNAKDNCFAGCRACPSLESCLRDGSLILHESTLAMMHILLGRRQREASCFLLLEYALPERNLLIPGAWLSASVEFRKKAEHRENFQAYMQSGALEGALMREKIPVIGRKAIALGMAALVRCQGKEVD